LHAPAIDDPGAADFDSGNIGVANGLAEDRQRPESKSKLKAAIAMNDG
jgi:hypothetical protein